MNDASRRTGIPVPVIAELIGHESGFRNVVNPKSGTRGFGQQCRGNRVMHDYRLNPNKPADSILGAAIELQQRLGTTNSMSMALRGYGTTSGMTKTQRLLIESRFAIATNRVAAEMVAQQVAPIVARR